MLAALCPWFRCQPCSPCTLLIQYRRIRLSSISPISPWRYCLWGEREEDFRSSHVDMSGNISGAMPRVLSRTRSRKAQLHYLDWGGEAAGGGGSGRGGGGGKGAASTCDAFYVYFRPGEKRGGRGAGNQTHIRDIKFHLRPLITWSRIVPPTFKKWGNNSLFKCWHYQLG